MNFDNLCALIKLMIGNKILLKNIINNKDLYEPESTISTIKIITITIC